MMVQQAIFKDVYKEKKIRYEKLTGTKFIRTYLFI